MIEENLIQDRIYSPTMSVTPAKILCQAQYWNPKLCTRAFHHVLITFGACKEPQKQSCQA